MNTFGKSIPTKSASVQVTQSKTQKSTVAELLSNQPDTTKRSLVASLTKQILKLSKSHDVLIVVTPKPSQ